MRIGIIIKEFETLANWQLRIIENIRNEPELETCLLIHDVNFSGKSRKRRIGEFLLKIQVLIERKFFFKNTKTLNKSSIIDYLKTLNLITIGTVYINDINTIGAEDSKEIKKYKLDLILNLDLDKIQGQIVNTLKHGILSILHNDISLNIRGPIAFWELFNKLPALGVSLQQQTVESFENLVIDLAYFNPHWSLVRTRDVILEGSVSLLIKNLKKLNKGIDLESEGGIDLDLPYRVPNVSEVLKYCFSFYFTLVKKIFNGLNSLFFGVRYQRWTLFLGKGDFLKAELLQLKPMELPKGEFWADPFIFHYAENFYIFYESYSYKTNKGKISCGMVKNDLITDIVDVLELDYHLSYPYVFEEEGEIFLMPETLDNKRLEIYKCLHFPNKWELYSTAFEGELVADAFFYEDQNKQKWLFINKKPIPSLPMDSELFIYKVESANLNNLVPHTQNPVIIDSRTARNGGAIFNFENELYRPSQRNVEGIYGRALNINKIKELTIDSYIEENNIIFEPYFHKGLISMHHLHQIKDLFVFDAAFKKK